MNKYFNKSFEVLKDWSYVLCEVLIDKSLKFKCLSLNKKNIKKVSNKKKKKKDVFSTPPCHQQHFKLLDK